VNGVTPRARRLNRIRRLAAEIVDEVTAGARGIERPA
jgi:hypothetical protein